MKSSNFVFALFILTCQESAGNRNVKRESWNLQEFVPCSNLAECLGNFNLIFPIRLNFNSITAYDRLKSHYQGKKGWSNKEIQRFDSLRNKMKRINGKENVKKRKHLAEMKMWRARIIRRKKEWLAFRSKSNNIGQNLAKRIKRHTIKNPKVWPYPYWPLRSLLNKPACWTIFEKFPIINLFLIFHAIHCLFSLI